MKMSKSKQLGFVLHILSVYLFVFNKSKRQDKEIPNKEKKNKSRSKENIQMSVIVRLGLKQQN